MKRQAGEEIRIVINFDWHHQPEPEDEKDMLAEIERMVGKAYAFIEHGKPADLRRTAEEFLDPRKRH